LTASIITGEEVSITFSSHHRVRAVFLPFLRSYRLISLPSLLTCQACSLTNRKPAHLPSLLTYQAFSLTKPAHLPSLLTYQACSLTKPAHLPSLLAELLFGFLQTQMFHISRLIISEKKKKLVCRKKLIS
jgi:hypothetical protein